MARRRISLLVTGSLVALGALIGVSLWVSTDTSRQTGPVDARPFDKGDEYVAIGDSYTSAPESVQSTDPCLQTVTNYPHKVAAKLGLKLKDVSCAGAATTHVTAPHAIGSDQRPPQADALSPRTDLVTVSMGGNDFNSFGAVAYGCAALRTQDSSGAPCQQADDAAGDKSVENLMKVTEQSLVDVIRQVAERAPQARIVLVGYPEIFPETGPCDQLPLALGDYPFARRVNELLVRAQERAAARTNVEYVDVFAATRGHDMCAKDPWIAGLSPTRSDAMPLHPYPEEQQLVAGLIVNQLKRAPTPNREQPADH